MPGHLLLILSPERSGSTLLSVMLGAHRRVLAPPELHLLRFPTFETWKSSYPIAFHSLSALWQMVGVEDDIETTCQGRLTVEIYRWLLARCSTDQILIDKTPAYCRSRSSLQRAEQLHPKYLWLVRHPLGVAASRMERRHLKRRKDRSLRGRLTYPLYALRRAVRGHAGRVSFEVRYWRQVHERIWSFLAEVEPDRWRRAHFEDLVERPRAEMKRLSDWLGLGLEPSMLQPHEHAPSELQWGLGDGKLLSHKSIDPAVAHRWRQSLDDSLVDSAARALMECLGVPRPPV